MLNRIRSLPGRLAGMIPDNIDRRLAVGAIIGVFAVGAIVFWGVSAWVKTQTEDPLAVAVVQTATVLAQISATPEPTPEGTPEPGFTERVDEITTQYDKPPWFVDSGEEGERRELFVPPQSLLQIVNDPPWEWILWAGMTAFLLTIVRRERFAQRQETDIRLVIAGVVAMLIAIILDDPLALVISQTGQAITGASISVSPGTVAVLGVTANLMLQLAASLSGRLDWTPLSVVGLFTTGAVLVWLYTEPGLKLTGTLLMIGGVLWHVLELRRQAQGGAAMAVGLAMVVVFLALKGLLAFLIGLVVYFNQPVGWPMILEGAARWLLSGLYSLRGVIAAVLAALVAVSAGEAVANWSITLGRKVVTSGESAGQEIADTPIMDAVALGVMAFMMIWVFVGSP